MKLEHFGEFNHYFALGVKVIMAVILGGIIGIDRERRIKSAGLKTNIMICLGSTLYTAISLMNYTEVGMLGDPNRIAAQIVSGIGFLGGGAIFLSRGNVVSGLTTAATIWMVAAIGVAVGSGYIISATFFTLTVLIVLTLVDPLYALFETDKNFHIELISLISQKDRIQDSLSHHHIRNAHIEEYTDLSQKKFFLEIYASDRPKKIKSFVGELQNHLSVKDVCLHPMDDFPPSVQKSLQKKSETIS